MKALITLLLLLTACAPTDQAEWVAVTQDTLIVGVDIEGSLQATDSTSIGPPGLQSSWRFTISNLTEDGEVVEAGATLVSFDGNELQERLIAEENQRDSTQVTLDKRRFEIALLDQDEALSLAEAEAAVRKANIGAEQSAELTASLVIKNAELDLKAAEANVTHLKAQIKRRRANNLREIATRESWVRTAEKNVANLNKDIASLSIKAPRAGTVVLHDNDSEKYKVGDQVYRSEFVMEVASLDDMRAEGTVDEADYGSLAIGQKVHLRLEAHPDSEVTGTLNEIARSVRQKSWREASKIVPVKLDIESTPDIQLRPGMRFRGEVVTETIEDAIILPLSSVFASSDGPIVFRKRAGKVSKQAIVLGKRGKRGIEVLEGLKVGDQVSSSDLRKTP